MPKRTQIVCLHEGERNKKGRLFSIDPIFANAFFKAYKPNWVRGGLRSVQCGGKTQLLERFPIELKLCGLQGGDTTMIVMADENSFPPSLQWSCVNWKHLVDRMR